MRIIRIEQVICYEKLWELQKSNKMTKRDLVKIAGLIWFTMTKLNKEYLISLEVMVRFCKIFHCDTGYDMAIEE